jgi:transposase
MIPFYKRMEKIYGDEVVFMEDRAMWHKAKIIKRYLANKGIRMMPHTPQSPDLNPIENVWKRIKDKIAKRKHTARNRLDFIIAMRQEWAEIEGDFCHETGSLGLESR